MSFHHITFEYDDAESYEFNMISWMQLVNEERFFYNEPAITVQEAKKSFLIILPMSNTRFFTYFPTHWAFVPFGLYCLNCGIVRIT